MLWRASGCAALFLFFCSPAVARPYQGGGQVGMSGSIIETPCAIDTGSRDQSIDMGSLPVGTIAREGAGTARPFSVLLVNCTVSKDSRTQPGWRNFRVTFEGHSDNGLFGVTGDARGVGLLLMDASGTVIHPGEPAPAGNLRNGNQRLDYRLHLAGNGKPFHPGDYRTSIRFSLDYY